MPPLTQSTQRKTGIDISSTGAIFETTTEGDARVSLNIEATAEASYALDVGFEDNDGTKQWFEGEEVYDQADFDTTDLRDAFIVGDERIRLRVTTAAASGETADVTTQQAH